MNEITTLYTTIGDYFTGSDWFQLVEGPFWILLTTVAFGGVYCARFGKKTLLNQGISGCFSLMLIYFSAVMLYIYFPTFRTMFSDLPFLSVTEERITLTDPATLDLTTMPPVVLRLMILVFMVNLVDSMVVGGKTALTWLCSQVIAVFISLVCNAIVIGGISMILPSILDRFAIIPVCAFIVIGIVMLCAKFVFTVVISGGNPYFSKVYQFFTVNKAGSLLTISALSCLLSCCVMLALRAKGHASLAYSSVNRKALWIILGLLVLSQYIFAIFYNDRKKG